jgi:hypothetical protein
MAINLGQYLYSPNNGNMTTLIRRDWSKVDDGNGPDGIYRSHVITFSTPSKIGIQPVASGNIMNVTKLEMAFGVSSWSGNTGPSVFKIQYTNDPTASANDATNDPRWVSALSYTSWNHRSGIVTVNTNFTGLQMRIAVDSSPQPTYYHSTVFRVYGEIVESTKYLIQDEEDIIKYNGSILETIGQTPVTQEMFATHGMSEVSDISSALWNSLENPKVLAYSLTSSALDAVVTHPTSIYNSSDKSYHGTGIIVTEMEEFPEARKSLMVNAEHEGCTFQYSLNNGVTWSPLTVGEVTDISTQAGNQLVIKVELPSDESTLTAISYAWA